MGVYQVAGQPVRSVPAGAEPVRVVLILEVPGVSDEMPTRAAQLADEFGSLVSHSIPGVRARKAVITVGNTAVRRNIADSGQHRVGLVIDRAGREILVDGHRAELTYREFELLAYLSSFPRRAVTRAELMREVWGEHTGEIPATVSLRTVDTHVRRVRAKLGVYARALTTVRGHGYRFDPGRDVVNVVGSARRLA